MPKLNTSKNIENYCRSRQYTLRKRLKNSQMFNNNRKLWSVKRKEIIMKNLSNTDELREEECDQSSTASGAKEENFDIVEGDQNDFHNNDAVNKDYDGNSHDVNDSDNGNDKIDDVVGDYDRENDEVPNNDDENNEIDDEIDDDEGDNVDHHDSDNCNNELDDNDEINGEASDDDDLQLNVEENEGNLPLYESSPITCSESMLSIFMYSIRHNLTGCALADLLSLISLHLPPNSKHKKTVHTFMKHFNGSKAQLIKHYYCSQCLANLKTIESNCSCVVQPQNNCESDKVENRPEILYFIEVPLYHQLKELFLRPGFINDLSYPYRRQKINDDCIEDIYDGLMYKEHIAEFNPDHDIFNLTFMWYTDGAPVFKSRTYSVWPFYFIINELPYEKRILRENIILAGLWFGPSDPKVNTFLRPIYNQMVLLSTGENFKLPESNDLQTVKAYLLCGTCDAPARADFLNHIRFNGDYGCPKCLCKGYTVREEGVYGNTHIYPFEGQLTPRTIDDYDTFVTFSTPKKPVYGVKCTSILSKMMPDMIRGTSIDVMHCVYLGVVKLLAKLWFDSAYRYKPWSLYAHRYIIDERLKKIQPPSFIKRMPRDLTAHSNHWKASEWKSFFLFYSLPLLEDLMDKVYLEHYIELVLGIYILNQQSISLESLALSENLLNAFAAKFQTLYDIQFTTFNIHCLRHLPQVVKDLGPLWITSCFFLEDLLGKMVGYVHGTRYVGLQIYTKFSNHLTILNKIKDLPEEKPVTKFCKKLKTTGKRVDTSRKIGENLYALGKMSLLKTKSQNLIVALVQIAQCSNNVKIHKFYRLKKQKQIIYSIDYSRKTAFASYCIKVATQSGPKIGFVKYFLKICNCANNCEYHCQDSRFYVFFKELFFEDSFKTTTSLSLIEGPNETRITVPYLHQIIERDSSEVLIDVCEIINLCYIIRIERNIEGLTIKNTYVGEQENNVEYIE